MLPQQRKACLVVIKAERGFPCRYGMTRLASSLIPLQTMRSSVAGGAVMVLKDVLVRGTGDRLCMTLHARDGTVRTCEIEAAFAVTDERECGWRETVNRVATLALVRVSRQELTGMDILVAVRAGPGLRVIVHEPAASTVTFFARHGRMLSQ